MSIVRDIGLVYPAFEERSLITCSTGSQVFAGSTANNAPSSTAVSGVAGRVVDRLYDLLASTRYQVAFPSAQLYSSRGSTEANRQMTLGVSMQHGDSSGGGDMVAYSTASDQPSVTFFSTARTSDQLNWDTAFGSTGVFQGMSTPATYDLRGAKRYIRMVVYASKNRVTTESSGDEGARLSGSIVFMGADTLLPPVNPRGPSSTTTST